MLQRTKFMNRYAKYVSLEEKADFQHAANAYAKSAHPFPFYPAKTGNKLSPQDFWKSKKHR